MTSNFYFRFFFIWKNSNKYTKEVIIIYTPVICKYIVTVNAGLNNKSTPIINERILIIIYGIILFFKNLVSVIDPTTNAYSDKITGNKNIKDP